jgi:hypothetical protein
VLWIVTAPHPLCLSIDPTSGKKPVKIFVPLGGYTSRMC